MTSVDAVADTFLRFAADNPRLAAGAVALVGSWFLYGVLGKMALGADDDYWPAIRGRLLPVLDTLAAGFPGFYAESTTPDVELVGVLPWGTEVAETELEALGYTRNPLAAYKTNSLGWGSAGSWAKRYRSIRWVGDGLRAWADRRSIPGPGWLADTLGRFLQASGDILALRQIHITLFEDPKTGRTWVYAHDEANSLNPLTAWAHYRGTGQRARKAVRRVRDTFAEAGIPFEVPDLAGLQTRKDDADG